MTSGGFDAHDHSSCIRSSISLIEESCAQRGLRLTDQRRRVLEILLTEHKAMGAYDILARLTTAGQAAQPPAVYRALGFLVDAGFAHKVESLNAFVACTAPGSQHAPAFMICRVCDRVAEAATSLNESSLAPAATAAGFQIETTVMEAEGLCPDCTVNAK